MLLCYLGNCLHIERIIQEDAVSKAVGSVTLGAVLARYSEINGDSSLATRHSISSTRTVRVYMLAPAAWSVHIVVSSPIMVRGYVGGL